MVSSVAACCVWPAAHAVLCIVNGDDSAVFHFLELGRDFYTMHLTTKFRHPTFSCSDVIVRTNTLKN